MILAASSFKVQITNTRFHLDILNAVCRDVTVINEDILRIPLAAFLLMLHGKEMPSDM